MDLIGGEKKQTVKKTHTQFKEKNVHCILCPSKFGKDECKTHSQ
jgi:hypothetical protein